MSLLCVHLSIFDLLGIYVDRREIEACFELVSKSSSLDLQKFWGVQTHVKLTLSSFDIRAQGHASSARSSKAFTTLARTEYNGRGVHIPFRHSLCHGGTKVK